MRYIGGMSETEDAYTNILLEEIRDQTRVLFDAVGSIQDELKQVPKRDEFEDLKADVRIIKAVVMDNCKQLDSHEKRIATLETVRWRYYSAKPCAFLNGVV